MKNLGLLASLLLALSFTARAGAPSWPDLSKEPVEQGGGAKDAALVIGIERYAFVPEVPGAGKNAEDWYVYLTKSRKVPFSRVHLLRDTEATVEQIRSEAALAAADVEPGGTLWVVFVGHGAPAKEGNDGVLVGVDAQQRANSLYARSIKQKDLLKLFARGKQERTVMVVDACFSGRATDGKELVKGLQPLIAVSSAAVNAKTTIFTAGRSDQFAGPLPGADRPAFSYLMLGALRGWADSDANGAVTPVEAHDYVKDALRALLKDRTQTPELFGLSETGVLAAGAKERGPDLTSMVLAATAAKSEISFASTNTVINVPKITVDVQGGGLKQINLQVEQALDRAMDAEQHPSASPDSKATAWCALANLKDRNPYLEKASDGCKQWTEFAAALKQQEQELPDDYGTLAGYIRLRHKTPEQKLAAVSAFLGKYSAMSNDARVTAVGGVRDALVAGKPAELAPLKPVVGSEPRSGLEFIRVNGGSFLQGCVPGDSSCDDVERPSKSVAVTAFSLARTEVSVAAYKRCVDAGACNAPDDIDPFCNWGKRPDHPVNCLDYDQAEAFCAWAGGRLPSASEWEFVAKGGRDSLYPWGSTAATVKHANFCDALCEFERGSSEKDGFATTSPVGHYADGATGSGVLDLAGNVWEWTATDFKKGAKEVRGGAWNTTPWALRASARMWGAKNARSSDIGFRCAWAAE